MMLLRLPLGLFYGLIVLAWGLVVSAHRAAGLAWTFTVRGEAAARARAARW